MFMPNDVFQIGSKRLRVLWSNSEVIFFIDIDNEPALPECSPRNEFEHLMAKGELALIDDPYLNTAMTSPSKGSKAEVVQERAWEAIEKAVQTEPDIYIRKERGPLFKDVMLKSDSTKQTVYRWCRRYWQLGMCKNALSGQYDRCGGLGKTKKLSKKKRGAPRTRTPGDGVNVDDPIKAIFRVSIENACCMKGSTNLIIHTIKSLLLLGFQYLVNQNIYWMCLLNVNFAIITKKTLDLF
jgi:putative transposase